MVLSELNQKYYYLFNDLDDASPALPERQYDIMAKVLQQQYVEELDTCLTEQSLVVGVENFELKFRAKYYLPRRVWLRWNKMAKALLNDYKTEFEKFLTSMKVSKKSQHEPKDDVTEDNSTDNAKSTDIILSGNEAVTPSKGDSDETHG